MAVSNAEQAARWWKEKLGFAVHHVGSSKHAVMVAPPGDRFVLHLCEGFEAVEPGNTGVAFMTDDIEALVRRMETGGVRFPSPPKQESWGGMAKFADPDGNIFWLLGAGRAFIRHEVETKAPRPRPTRSRPRPSSGPARRANP